MASPRVTRVLAYTWVVLVALLMLGPVLLPGFVLSYDLVFTPRQDLLPGSLGVGSGLPRAVPQDAIVALIEIVVPGMIVEKLVLLAIPVLVGTGMLRLLRGTAAGVVAATLAMANPFVAQRLVIGHWGLLLAYALVPWALVVARRLRATGDAWDGLRLLLLVAAGALTPSGSLLIATVAVPPVLLPGSRYSVRSRVLLAAGVTATWLPWLLPALLHPSGTGADPAGNRIFALRPDAPGGVLVTALTGGGLWNAEAVLPSRATPLTWVLLVAVLGLGAWGATSLARRLGRTVTTWWTIVAVDDRGGGGPRGRRGLGGHTDALGSVGRRRAGGWPRTRCAEVPRALGAPGRGGRRGGRGENRRSTSGSRLAGCRSRGPRRAATGLPTRPAVGGGWPPRTGGLPG